MIDYGFTAGDGTNIHAVKWECSVPRAVLQIVHGMAEYVERYDEFARYMNSRGIVVAGENHRGHGKTAGNLENAGYFADENGWEKVIADNVQLGSMLRKEYPGKPFYLLGHSMGSFISRCLIAESPEGIDKVILSGSGEFSSAQVNMLGLLASLQVVFKGARSRAKLLDKLSFSQMNSQFQPGKTGFEWLSRDEDKVQKYVDDPFCGFVCTAGFYRDFARGVRSLQKKNHLEKIPKNLPILLYSGSEDPVGGNGITVERVYRKYRKSGHGKAEFYLNPGGRHESLNETNRRDVYTFLADWLEG